LIKDNHVAAVGSISEAINRARQNVHHLLKVEVEVTNLAEVKEALQAEADIILLDNMDLCDMQKAVQMVAGKACIEASGGVEMDKLEKIAEAGVDYISMGALTHSARAMDISLELVPPEKK
jgi:nicotinate-nucleotide pyrophosphorylase (carboxylating)